MLYAFTSPTIGILTSISPESITKRFLDSDYLFVFAVVPERSGFDHVAKLERHTPFGWGR
jgi:hypothetical protein